MDGVSLFGESRKFIHLSNYKYCGPENLSESAFNEIFSSNNVKIDFSLCHNSLQVFRIKEKSTGLVYNVLATYSDACDGGNSQGVLFNREFNQILGVIHDTEIICH